MIYHFISIGGAAMHNLAIALHLEGHTVTGSDDEIFEPSRSRLERHGLLPATEGWDPGRLHTGIDAIILGMHAREDNPELMRAKELGLTIHSFPSFLYEHARDKRRIVIGGSHGKTTITSMIIHVLEKLGKDFDFMVGALVEGFDVMVRLSKEAPVMIFEGDEYLTSALDPRPKFHLYRPHIAVLSGIAWDHMNVFPSFDDYVEQFRRFIGMLPADGRLYYCDSDAELNELVGEFETLDTVGYGSIGHEVLPDGGIALSGPQGPVAASFFGRHNLMNAQAAYHICSELGVSKDEFIRSLADFKGAGNRLELIYQDDHNLVFRDFAHAPSKVRATVDAVRERYRGWELNAVLELHTYSSLNREFLPQYAGTLDHADRAAVYLNPHAFMMKKLPMIPAEEVVNEFGKQDLAVLGSGEETEAFFHRHLKPGQVWLFMSSGNFGGAEISRLFEGNKSS